MYKDQQVIMIDLMSFHPDLMGWQIANQIVCCEAHKTVGGISCEPDHIWIKSWMDVLFLTDGQVEIEGGVSGD